PDERSRPRRFGGTRRRSGEYLEAGRLAPGLRLAAQDALELADAVLQRGRRAVARALRAQLVSALLRDALQLGDARFEVARAFGMHAAPRALNRFERGSDLRTDLGRQGLELHAAQASFH